MAFINACQGVLTIFCIGLLGYFLARGGKIPASFVRMLPKFVTTIVLPPYLLRNITATFERDQLIHLLYGAVIPIISILVTFGMAVALSRIMKVAKNRKGIFCTGFSTSSTVNIGLPINIALFGEAALPYVLLYFFANAILFWTFGNYSIAHDGESADVKLFSLTTLKQICSPPLVGFILGVILVLLDIRLPSFVDKSFKYVGDMTIALSIMYIGITLNDISFKNFRLERDISVAFAGRFLISPLCVLLLTLVFPIPPLMRNVFILQSSLPVMMNVSILAGYYKADVRYATLLTSVSTIISLISIPLYMVIIAQFL